MDVKKHFLILLALLLLCSCARKTPNPEAVIETEYYTVTMPQAWLANCTYTFEKSTYGTTIVTFYENTSYAAGKGGKLCSIQLIPVQVDWASVEDASLLCSLQTPDGLFHIVASIPWETQCNKETYETYEAMRKLTQDLFHTITPKDGCKLNEEGY